MSGSTSRCRRTGLARYRSKQLATRAATMVLRPPAGGLEPVACDYRGPHWHLWSPGQPLPHASGVFDASQWDEATLKLWQRCRDFCEWCDEPLAGSMVRHHRMRREVGGDSLANLVALHDPCHRYVHAHPLEAKHRGHIVAPEGNVYATPILIKSRRYWLTDDGRRIG